MDAIGDYVLFRNYLELLKKNHHYGHYRTVLVGNILWQNLAKTYDSKFVDHFIWVDLKRFSSNKWYRFNKLLQTALQYSEIAINPTYSRNLYTDDEIIHVSGALRRIGSIGDCSNNSKDQKSVGDTYYTELLPASPKIIFEFNRNKEFFRALFGEEPKINKPYLTIIQEQCSFTLDIRYCVMFPGATDTKRKWSSHGFIEVAKHLLTRYKISIVICGGPLDQITSNEIESALDGHVINLVGKTSLVDLSCILAKSVLIVSNETSAPHFGVALDVETIVISNGNHFGRFNPYPAVMAPKYHVVYPPQITKYLESPAKLINEYGPGSNLDINEIGADLVNKEIDLIFEGFPE